MRKSLKIWVPFALSTVLTTLTYKWGYSLPSSFAWLTLMAAVSLCFGILAIRNSGMKWWSIAIVIVGLAIGQWWLIESAFVVVSMKLNGFWVRHDRILRKSRNGIVGTIAVINRDQEVAFRQQRGVPKLGRLEAKPGAQRERFRIFLYRNLSHIIVAQADICDGCPALEESGGESRYRRQRRSRRQEDPATLRSMPPDEFYCRSFASSVCHSLHFLF